MRTAVVSLCLIALAGCGEAPKPAPAPEKRATAPKPLDESHRLPRQGQVETKLVEKELMGKSFLPGGNVGTYKQGGKTYEVFMARLSSAEDSPLALLQWKKEMTGARLIPSFGGYFGDDAGQPVFVFTKGAWIAGVKGLPEKDADPVARELASRLN